jgi:TonB family protein
MNKPALVALLAALAAAPGLHAQEGAVGAPERCAAVPDTVKPPTAPQIRDRNQLRESVARIFREGGHPATGLLYVEVDRQRRRTVEFLGTDPPAQARQRAEREIGRYLQALPPGHPFQALLRLDGAYPVIAPGKHHCVPELDNPGEFMEARGKVMEGHPMARTAGETRPVQVAVILVVDRTGRVAWAALAQPTGDAYVDEHATAMVQGLRFLPALLDGVPIDARTRFTFTLRVH